MDSQKNRHEQGQTPLLALMQDYCNQEVLPFHTPGHKQGKGMDETFKAMMGEQMLPYDLSLMDEWDDLNDPHGAILAAERLAAKLYGADASFFVINGTTAAIQAMLLAVAGPGDKIIVPRNCHRSVMGGLLLSGATPVYMQPEVDPEWGIAHGVTVETVCRTLARHPDAKAVLLVSPTYYGVASDLPAICRAVHEYNIPVLVDEAHGPHLRFSEMLPPQALDAGADLTAQSTHKILGAMTQCSMLHCKGMRISSEKVQAVLAVLQSTSPNYILLASLDAARRQMGLHGPELIARAIKLAQRLRDGVNQIDGLASFGAGEIGRPGFAGFDSTKVTVSVKRLGISGAIAEQFLRREKIQMELCDVYNILFLITFGDSAADIDRLLAALKKLADYYRLQQLKPFDREEFLAESELPEAVLSPRDAFSAPAETVPFSQSAGRISAEVITFYPPGIPLICPGEKITGELIRACQMRRQAGLKVSGPKNANLETVQVIRANLKGKGK